MNLPKFALVSAAAFGLVLSGTAQAASTRAGASLPVVTAKAPKASASRTSARTPGEANLDTTGSLLLGAAFIAAGVGFYELVKTNDTPGG